MTWLHFIGKQYYTEKSFIKEALQYGVSRRVDLRVLTKMEYGDRILLALMDGKSPVVFGQFRISKVTGLTDWAAGKISLMFNGAPQEEYFKGVVFRGCGHYEISKSYVVSSTLDDIAQALKLFKEDEEGYDIGLPMIGGNFEVLERVRLKDVPFRQGYRTFDWISYINEVEKERKRQKREVISVRGQFYVDECDSLSAHQNYLGVESVKGYVRENNKNKNLRELMQNEINFGGMRD